MSIFKNIKIDVLCKFAILSLVAISFLNSNIRAQTPRETRAVWVSTNFRLDWPPNTTDEKIQKKKLIDIFKNIERKNLNTIFFQVRSNGTLLFRSGNELFSPYVTGNIGEFGDYDPLQFAVEEAHKRGLEIHAWLNTFRLFSGNDISIKNNLLHLSKLHPEWILKTIDDNSIWLNPGIHEVREYLVNIVDEIVSIYDVDGIHLDFVRYPQGVFDDSESFEKNINGKNRNDWRRGNITKFVSELYSSIKNINPRVKLGVTPIGIYKSISGGRGLEGFSDAYQDSREWMRLGIIDYAVPQIYWDTRKNPKFETVAKDWIDNSFGKNIILGIAAYKPEVQNELEREIFIARKLKASGVAFFRYSNIANIEFKSFNEKAIPPENVHELVPEKLFDLTLTSVLNKNKCKFKFYTGSKTSTKGYFGIWEWENSSKKSNKKLIRVIPNSVDEISFLVKQPSKINYFYSAIEYNQLWNEISYESKITKVTIPSLINLGKEIVPIFQPILSKDVNGYYLLLVSNSDEKISVEKQELGKQTLLLNSVNLRKGINKIRLNIQSISSSELILKFLYSNETVSININ